MKQLQALVDREIKGEIQIFYQNSLVVCCKKAQRSTSKVNVELVNGIKEAYAKYLHRLGNPYAQIKKQRFKDVPFLVDYMDAGGVAGICLASNQYQVVCLGLHPIATADMNDELIREIKSVYGQYLVEVLDK